MIGLLPLLFILAFGQQTTTVPRPGPAAPKDDVKGTAVIRGRILTADSGQPLRRAQIVLTSPQLPQSRTTSTNLQGAYLFKDLPAGRYTISARRSGFISMLHGQRRPGEPPKPLQVSDGQVIERLDVALPRAGVIGGRISDEAGEPFAGVSVWAMQSRFFRGRRRLIPMMSAATTDDSGQYRILGVPPGEYVVMATTRETWKTGGEKKEVLGYAAAFYPGVPAADAQRVRIGAGEQRSDTDFSLQPLRAATISGTATSSDGTPLVGRTVSLNQEFAGPEFSMSWGGEGTKIAADGTWRIRDVPPGDYQLDVTVTERGRAAESALVPISVQGTDIEGISIVTDSGGTLAGQVLTDDGSPLPTDVRLRVTAQTALPDRRPSITGPGEDNGVVATDGTFTFSGLTGPAIVRVGQLPAGWAIKSVDVSGQEQVDTPLEIRGGRRVDGARIVLTKRFPTITARVTDDQGKPAEGTVILFAADSSKWLEAAGAARTARPDQSGTYRFDAVRPGDYLVIALEYVQQWQVGDPEFLADLRDRATRVTLSEREAEVINLKLHR